MNIGRAVRAGRVKKKKDSTGQDRTGQENKSQKGYISPIWGEAPHWSDLRQKLCSRWPPRRNHVCQVSKWNFQELRFYRGSNFPFSYWFLNGPYNSAALLRCLWLSWKPYLENLEWPSPYPGSCCMLMTWLWSRCKKKTMVELLRAENWLMTNALPRWRRCRQWCYCVHSDKCRVGIVGIEYWWLFVNKIK